METFVTIKLAEMESVLSEAKGWVKSDCPGYEWAFDYKIKSWPDVVVRVYSTINKDNGLSRGKSSDAIRVFAVDLKNKRGLVSSLRVYRTTNWRTNLQTTVLKVLEVAKSRLRRNLRR